MTAAENSKLHAKVPTSGLVVTDISQLQVIIQSLVQAINDTEVRQNVMSDKFEKSIKAADGKFDWLCGELRKLEGAVNTGEESQSPAKGRGAVQRGSIASSMPSAIAAVDDVRDAGGGSSALAARIRSSLTSSNPGAKPATMSHFDALDDHLKDLGTEVTDMQEKSSHRFDQIEQQALKIEHRLREHQLYLEQGFMEAEKKVSKMVNERLEKLGNGIRAEFHAFQDKTNNTFVDVANQIKDLEARLQMLHRTTSDDNTATHGRIDRLVKLQKDFAEDMAQGRSESKRDARQARDDTRCAVAAAVREARTISSRMEQLSSAIPVDLSGSASTGLDKFQLQMPAEARRSGQLRLSVVGGVEPTQHPLQRRPSSAGSQRLAVSRASTLNRPQSARSAMQRRPHTMEPDSPTAPIAISTTGSLAVSRAPTLKRPSTTEPDDLTIQGTTNRALSPAANIPEDDLSPFGSESALTTMAMTTDVHATPSTGRILVREEIIYTVRDEPGAE